MVEIRFKYTLNGVHFLDALRCKYVNKKKTIVNLKREYSDCKIIDIRRVSA